MLILSLSLFLSSPTLASSHLLFWSFCAMFRRNPYEEINPGLVHNLGHLTKMVRCISRAQDQRIPGLENNGPNWRGKQLQFKKGEPIRKCRPFSHQPLTQNLSVLAVAAILTQNSWYSQWHDKVERAWLWSPKDLILNPSSTTVQLDDPWAID